jgi:acyl-CoA thioesterase FadM
MLAAIALSMCVALSGDDWTPLPIPALCAERITSQSPPPLYGVSHLRVSNARGRGELEKAPPRLPLALVGQMLEEDARARGLKLEFFRGAPEILVRGDAAAVAAARALVSELDRASDALTIDLEITLTPSRASSDNVPKAVPARYEKRVRSGESTSVGRRGSQSYVADFEVDVAASSGVARPVMGSAVFGTTVHVRAARVDGGRRVHLTGLLDLAELASIEVFDPKTVDLGELQQPVVHSAQIVFAGVVESGQALEATLVDPALSTSEWNLSIRASARADLEPKEGETAGWSLIDLSLLATEPTTLPPFGPGHGLDVDAMLGESSGTQASLPASALAVALEAARSASASPRGSSRPPLYWTHDLLFVPRADANAVREARALVKGAESSRARTGRLDVRSGAARASIPLCEGTPARVWIGTERCWLVGYRADIAPQTWMPSPEIESTFDGVAVSALAQSGVAQCAFWAAESEPNTELSRETAQLGRLQVLNRSVQSGTARATAGSPEQRALDVDGPMALSLRYQSP